MSTIFFFSLLLESNDLFLSSLNQELKNNKNELFVPKLNWKNIELLKLYNLCDV